jgi:hypothetical protein
MEYGHTQNQKYSAELSDVFTLGMIILEVLHLSWMNSVYENGYVSSGRLQHMLDLLKFNHSETLKNVVTKMVKLDPYQRITLEDI